jgi:serine/threonine protein kinase
MSPELLNDEILTEKSDIFSLGMVLIEMITSEIPYSNVKSRCAVVQKIKSGEKPENFDRISDEGVKQFVSKLLEFDPAKRPSVEQLLDDEFLKISKEDDRVIKIKPRKKVKDKKNHKNLKKNRDEDDFFGDDIHNFEELERKNRKKLLFKQDFEENPYFEDMKKDKRVLFDDAVNNRRRSLKNADNNFDLSLNKQIVSNIDIDKRESTINLNQAATSSHECGTQYSKYNSDVYHQSTDHMNNPHGISGVKKSNNSNQNVEKKSSIGNNNIKKQEIVIDNRNNTEIHLVEDGSFDGKDNLEAREQFNDMDLEKVEGFEKSRADNDNDNDDDKEKDNLIKKYQIIDDEYNVHLKFLISQDGKLHEIQFTYNLIKDEIPNLMEEIKNEFNFSRDNLNHIYETLRKVHIYSKFCKNSELLPDNSF